MTNLTIESTISFKPLFAKVSFNGKMSSMQMFELKKQWKEFQELVDGMMTKVVVE